MKTSIFLTVLMFWVGFGFAQTNTVKLTETTEFKVYGNCGMCKARIEKAAKTDGVLSAVWSEKTHMLKIEYNPSKVKVATIHQNIAKVGHDTELSKADDAVYNKLPGCCKYERSVQSELKEPEQLQHP
ncbi:MAG: cation transporter [Bacteroidales bacterium]|nr:cation transporter [Bacteroidales bacterium]